MFCGTGRMRSSCSKSPADADDLLLNEVIEVIWRSVRGAGSPMPAPKTRRGLSPETMTTISL